MQNSWRLQGKGGITEGGISLLENSWFCIGISRGKSLILAVWHTHTQIHSGVLPGGGLQRTPAAEQGKNWPQTRWRAAFVVVAGGCEERETEHTACWDRRVEGRRIFWRKKRSLERRKTTWIGSSSGIHSYNPFLTSVFFWREISLWRVSRKGFFPSLLLLKFLLHIPHW